MNKELIQGIPGPQEPWAMSFSELAIAMAICEPGSRRYREVEAEMRRRARAEGCAARHPPVILFLAGALVAITAFYCGAALDGVTPRHYKSSFSLHHAMQQELGRN